MWLDTVIAVPLIGLHTTPSFSALYRYPERLQPMLDDLLSRDHEIQLVNQPSGGFQFRSKRGFTYKVLVDNIVVEFEYRSTERRVAGRQPATEMPPIESFGTLLDETINQVVRVVTLLEAAEPFRVRRCGLLANALMEKSKAPPGIVDVMSHHGEVFSGDVIKADATFLANLEANEDHTDRCHHAYTFDDTERPDHLAVKLDWQRVFKTPLLLSAPADQLRRMKDAALAYFERVGQGGLRDA